MVVFMSISVNALCWNPLELFCLFEYSGAESITTESFVTEASVTTETNFKIKSDGITFNKSRDFIDISINNTIFAGAINISYEEREDGIYPYFEFVVPNALIANAIKGRSFTIPYKIKFNKNISNSLNNPLISLGKNYYFKPIFNCEINGQDNIEGIVSRSLIDYNVIRFDVKFNFSGHDVSSGDKIKCKDPILNVSTANFFVVANDTTSTKYIDADMDLINLGIAGGFMFNSNANVSINGACYYDECIFTNGSSNSW